MKTSRSLAWITSSGPTGPMTSPSRSISIRNRPGRCRSPASRDRLAHQPAARLDQHLDQVLAPRLLELLDQLLAVRQELPADRQEVGRAQEAQGRPT